MPNVVTEQHLVSFSSSSTLPITEYAFVLPQCLSHLLFIMLRKYPVLGATLVQMCQRPWSYHPKDNSSTLLLFIRSTTSHPPSFRLLQHYHPTFTYRVSFLPIANSLIFFRLYLAALLITYFKFCIRCVQLDPSDLRTLRMSENPLVSQVRSSFCLINHTISSRERENEVTSVV